MDLITASADSPPDRKRDTVVRNTDFQPPEVPTFHIQISLGLHKDDEGCNDSLNVSLLSLYFIGILSELDVDCSTLCILSHSSS